MAAFPRLAARFSFSDFPDFLDIVCRGDLSDIAAPFTMGGLRGPRPPDSTPCLRLDTAAPFDPDPPSNEP